MVLAGVILAMLLSSLDQTIVSTAMPTIVHELHGLEHISWVFTAYMLGSTVTVPIYGKLSDMFGRRNLYILGILLFMGGSILCGISGSMNQLILFRAIQGIGGGAMMVNSFAIIGDVFPPAERGKYQGLIGGVFGLSSIGGPLLGGWITDHVSWRWVFYVNIPLGIIAILVLSAALPKIARHDKDRNIDFAGAFLLITALVPLLLSLVWGGSLYPWASWQIALFIIISFVSILLFIRTEKKAQNPILSLNLFQNKVFLVSVFAMFLTAMGMFGAIIYIPLFSQGVIGGSATHAGLVLTPMMLALVTSSAISGQIISRTGKYKMLAITGTAITVLALFLFSTIDETTRNPMLIFRMIVLGFGLGSTMPIFTLAVQSAFGKERLGEVTAGTQLFRSIGGTVGTAILGGIMNSRLSEKMHALSQEAFITRWSHLYPEAGQHEGSMIQSILNPQNQIQIKESINQLPPGDRVTALSDFTHFLGLSRIAFSASTANIFLVGAFLMAIALVVVFFLPEIPLRKSDVPATQSAGLVLEDELGISNGTEKSGTVLKQH
jgi:EmrB/QacA subfamily drug resistance transporter